MEKKFIITDVLKEAWVALKKECWLLVGLTIGYTLIVLTIQVFIPDMKDGISLTAISLILLSVTFSIIFTLGYTKNLFQAIDKDEPQFSAYGRQSIKFFTFLITSMIYTIIVCIGMALLLIPGIYMAIRLQFFTASIVDENTGITGSLKRSWEITKGQTWSLFFLMLIMTGFYIIGILAFIIGVFVVVPFISLMYCYVFRQLTRLTE